MPCPGTCHGAMVPHLHACMTALSIVELRRAVSSVRKSLTLLCCGMHACMDAQELCNLGSLDAILHGGVIDRLTAAAGARSVRQLLLQLLLQVRRWTSACPLPT